MFGNRVLVRKIQTRSCMSKKTDKAAKLLKEYSAKLGRPPEDIVTIGIIFCLGRGASVSKTHRQLSGFDPAALPLP